MRTTPARPAWLTRVTASAIRDGGNRSATSNRVPASRASCCASAISAVRCSAERVPPLKTAEIHKVATGKGAACLLHAATGHEAAKQDRYEAEAFDQTPDKIDRPTPIWRPGPPSVPPLAALQRRASSRDCGSERQDLNDNPRRHAPFSEKPNTTSLNRPE